MEYQLVPMNLVRGHQDTPSTETQIKFSETSLEVIIRIKVKVCSSSTTCSKLFNITNMNPRIAS